MSRGFCCTYSRLAALAFGRQFTFFGLVPKAHALGYSYFELERTWQNVYSLNPAVWDMSLSEDFVGRAYVANSQGLAMATFQATPLWSIESKPDF